MKQSRAMSLVVAVANVIVGYGVAVVTQILKMGWSSARYAAHHITGYPC